MGKSISKTKPSLDPDFREKQVMARAVDLAEKKMDDGTATSQMICHYLEKASPINQLKEEKLRKEIALLDAKIEATKAIANNDEVAKAAIEAMRRYSGHADEGFDDDDD